jgi:septum site-determining protein MinD
MGTSRVYAVASGKGGVGKTTSVVNLGAGFAEAGRSVVVVDVDLGMANLRDVLDVPDEGATLHNVLAGEADLAASLRSVPGGFDVIVGSPSFEAFGNADPGELGSLVAELRDRYDVVILDTGAGLNYDAALPLGLADEVVLVSTPDEAALNNTETTRELVSRLDGEVAGVILNRVGGAAGRPPDDVESRLGVSVLGSVPEDSNVPDSAATGTPVVVSDDAGPAAQSFREIAYAMLGEPLPMDWSDRETSGGIASAPVDTGTDAVSDDAGVMAEADDDILEAGGAAAESEPEPAVDEGDDEERSDPMIAGDDGGDLESTATVSAGADADDTAAEGDDAADTPAGDVDGAEDTPADDADGAEETESTGPGLADAIESAESDPDGAGSSLVGQSDAGDAPLSDGPIEDAEAEDDDEESRSLLSKVTGGLLG